MKQLLATITAAQPLTDSLRLLTLSSPDLPQLRAGQLILVRANDSFDPYLRAAFFPIPSVMSQGSCSILMRRDVALQRLYQIGDMLDLIAPVGNGFALEASTRYLLLVGDDAHIAPLIALAHEATQRQVAVTFLIEGGDDPASRLYESLLPLDVEYQFVSDVPADLLRWPDQICVAGSPALYMQIKDRLTQSTMRIAQNFAQVIAAPPTASGAIGMACGFGACLACAVETTRGMKLACLDGPVFDLMELSPVA